MVGQEAPRSPELGREGGGGGQAVTNSPLSPGRASMRDKVAQELLESEITFVDQMRTLVSVFIKPLRWWAAELQNNYGKGSMHPVLPEMFLNEIFANVEQLLVFNQHIVEQFTEIYKTTKAFGGFFKKAAPFFKMYSSYVSNYDRAMDTLMNLIETRLDFASFVRACELQEGCKGLNLRSYLIMPVQRIPRYKLLLSELLKHTPEDHKDYQDLVAAVALVSGVVNSINEDIKRQEKRFKVMEVQERFDTLLVTASRTHVREGELIKMCRKGPKRFIFVLFNDLLIYGSQKIASSDKCSLHRKMELGELFIVDSGENERSFVVATKVKSFVVQCKDLSEKKDWMGAFAACFLELEKTLYGRGAQRGAATRSTEGRISSIPLWMVREGNMVRETYLMPDTEEKAFGFLNFNELRLIVDPQAQEKASGVGQQVMNLLRRGSLAQYSIKVGPENPVPCEQVSNIVTTDMSEDDSNYTLSPSSESSSPRGSSGGSNRLSISMADNTTSPNQADLLGLGDSSGSFPISPAVSDTNSRGGVSAQGSRASISSIRSVSSNPQAPQQQQQQQQVQAAPQQPQAFQPTTAPPNKAPPKPALPRDQMQWPPYQHPQAIHELQQKQLDMYDKEVSSPQLQQRSSVSSPPQGQQRHQQEQWRSETSPGHHQQQQPQHGRVSQSPDPFQMNPELTREPASTSPSLASTSNPLEYVAVIPVTEMGLGLFLKDENGQVVIGGFRSPRTGLGINPSQRAGVKLGDSLVRVNGVPVSTVAQTIAALRESRMEQVIALTLRKSEANAAAAAAASGSFGSSMTGGGGGLSGSMKKSTNNKSAPPKAYKQHPGSTVLS